MGFAPNKIWCGMNREGVRVCVCVREREKIALIDVKLIGV